MDCFQCCIAVRAIFIASIICLESARMLARCSPYTIADAANIINPRYAHLKMINQHRWHSFCMLISSLLHQYIGMYLQDVVFLRLSP